ncbi:MAG: LPS export ABC transporter permease LptG [Nitrospinae bacterium]|nr:LPS export ABC transporter permease LptG [Nitrospinota bacterium]
MMSLLKRYVLGKFVYSYLLSAAGLIGIFLVIDFFERVDEFVSRGLPMSDLMYYYIYKVPYIAFYMAPQAVLLATVITLATLARDNEIVAMKACGIGVTSITIPIIASALVIALLILASNEYITPITNKKMNYIFYVKVRKEPSYGTVQREKLWLVAKDGAIWNIKQFDPEKGRMKNVSIFFNYGSRSIQKRIDATEVVWTDNRWEFLDGYQRTFHSEGLDRTTYFEKRTFPVAETPEDFKKMRIFSGELSLREMYRKIQELAAEGKPTAKKRVELQQRLSYPFISIVLALLAIPLSLRSSRHGGVLFCVGVNMAMGFAFSFIYALGISLGFGGIFSPFLAAWGPLLFFMSIGFYLIFTLDSEEIFPRLKI